jgi:hypothetical protein
MLSYVGGGSLWRSYERGMQIKNLKNSSIFLK